MAHRIKGAALNLCCDKLAAIANNIGDMQNQTIYIRPQYRAYYVPYNLIIGKLYEGLEAKTC